jgi:uncharacterized protein (DUF58 family)
MIKKFFASLYLSTRFFIAAGILAVLFVCTYFFSAFYVIVKTIFNITVLLFLVDILLLYILRDAITAKRIAAEKLSNGDDNPFIIELTNLYPFPIDVKVYDELPEQFQLRDNYFKRNMDGRSTIEIHYKLRPLKRGNYNFGALNVFVHTLLGFAVRRFKLDQDLNLPVYPSFIQMRKYEFLAIHNRLQMAGIKKIRRIGNNFEFEQIKDYVQGDDYRTVNWKATARKGNLMVNQFQDERSQNIYCIIDKGRMMKMPFEKLSLLDYSINAALALSNIAIRKSDRAGIITFNENKIQVLKADNRNSQMMHIADMLHQQKTRYLESNYEALYIQIRQLISQRSLCLLFTNFESLSSMQRNLKFLISIAKRHTLVVVFFENTEIQSLIDEPAETSEEIYIKTIAEKFAFEKKQMVLELHKHGIHTILTPPQKLTVNSINKYLELKARGLV